ncbi:MAG: response regulator [Candidatus Methylomirabilis oxyfera]|nr:response regulator [Candidatus Methylomirabilis oxyfera]
MKIVRILLVDDEEEVLRLLQRRLTRRGYAVTTATDGSQALASLQHGAFDVAILDFMMPGMNGLELAGQCRARDPGLRILMLTGSPVIGEIEAEGYLCLRKPLENLEELDQAIERLLAPESEGHPEGRER